jgi:hypothetical protein
MTCMKTIGLNNGELSTMSNGNGTANGSSGGKKGEGVSHRPSVTTLITSFAILAGVTLGM